MSFFGALGESIDQVAYAVSKNGFGKSMAFNAASVGHSAAYNKTAAAAKGIINSLGDDEAKAIRSAISKGDDLSVAMGDVLNRMGSGDEAQRKLASEFNDVLSGYEKAKGIAEGDASKAVGAYAEFLGRENGKLSLGDAAWGYFGDKQLGGTRIKGALGVAAGVGVASRLLSGGSLTRTNTGERDIAGVPFI